MPDELSPLLDEWFGLLRWFAVGDLRSGQGPTPVDYAIRRGRFDDLTRRLAREAERHNLDSSPYFLLTGDLDGAAAELWNEAHALTNRLGLRLQESPPPDGHLSPDLPMLSGNASYVYEVLLALKPHEALTSPEIARRVYELSGYTVNLDESTIRKLMPSLEPYGIEHKPKIGYRIKPSMRPPTARPEQSS